MKRDMSKKFYIDNAKIEELAAPMGYCASPLALLVKVTFGAPFETLSLAPRQSLAP